MVTIGAPRKYKSPYGNGMCRIASEVSVGDETRTLWIDYPKGLDEYVDVASGDAWAILGLPIAMVQGEQLVLPRPVNSRLLDGIRSIQRVWCSWYNWLSPVDVHMDCVLRWERENGERGRDVGLFFSGGIDSLFSFIRRDIWLNTSSELTLIAIHGFDIPLDKPDEFEKVAALAEDVASQVDASVLTIRTNLREFDAYRRTWGNLSHGAALAGVGHLFSGKFSQLIIGSTYDVAHLAPWGSHQITDPMFSSRNMEIVHDGAGFSRIEKTKEVFRNPNLGARVRVCWERAGAFNCSRCVKCLRTMATIDVMGRKAEAVSFDWTGYTVDKVSQLFLSSDFEEMYFYDILEEAKVSGREELVKAVGIAIWKSKWKRWVRKYCRPMGYLMSKMQVVPKTMLNRMDNVPMLWRLAKRIRRSFFRPESIK